MKKTFALVFLILALLIGSFVSIKYYSYVFAISVKGVIQRVERVTSPQTMIVSGADTKVPNEQIFSFAVSIKSADGEIHTASSEDRQWAVAQAGQCVEAKFFPYPLWNFEKHGTYFGARILRLFDCAQSNSSGGESGK